MNRCHEFGGRNNDGSPCMRPVEDGLCYQHDPEQPLEKRGGRPMYEPSDQERKFVETCALGGIGQEEICRVLEISKPTLHKHFREELDKSYAKAK